MSKNKYLRLKGDNVGEFEWQTTQDDKIIVRYKEDGEIFAVIDRPLGQRYLIADSFHAGLNTGLELQTRYIDFLEGLTAPLMPDYNLPISAYEEYTEHPTKEEVYVCLGSDGKDAKHYLYEICIPTELADLAQSVCDNYKVKYIESFYTNACNIWIEKPTQQMKAQPFAAPSDGELARVFMTAADRAKFIWLADQIHFNIADLIYTAIKQAAEHHNYESDDNVIPIKDIDLAKSETKAVANLKMTKVSASSI